MGTTGCRFDSCPPGSLRGVAQLAEQRSRLRPGQLEIAAGYGRMVMDLGACGPVEGLLMGMRWAGTLRAPWRSGIEQFGSSSDS